MTFSDAAKMTLVKPFILNFAEAVVFANNLFIVSIQELCICLLVSFD